MVNKDMNGFPVKKCSAFQFFKKRVRRWIKSPMVSVDKHQSPSLKYTGPSVVHIPPGEADFESALCQTCLGDHVFQRGVPPPEKESCSWESQSGGEVKEPCHHANILTKPDSRTFWTTDDSGFKKRSVEKELHPGKPSKVTVNLTESNNHPTENESPKKRKQELGKERKKEAEESGKRALDRHSERRADGCPLVIRSHYKTNWQEAVGHG